MDTINARDNSLSRRHAIASFAALGTCLLPRAAASPALTRLTDVRAIPDLSDDGSAGAVPGTPQMTQLLHGYTTRPAWKVAGVDYAVGVPAWKKLTDWRALDLPNARIDGHSVEVGGDDAVLYGIDFSTDGGAQLYIRAKDSVAISNCQFGGDYLKTITTGIIDTSSPRMMVQNCSFDGAGAGIAACVLFVQVPVTATVNYCHVYNYPCRVIQLGSGGTLDYRFNLIGEGAMQAGAHLNYLEFGSGEARPVVAYNTTAQTAMARSGGEGFQFYFNGGGTMHEPLCVRNTMIARGGGGSAVMSYLVHGSGYRQGVTTAVLGRPVVQGNFMDTSSAYGPFYGGSFSGWEIHDNVDMVTRRVLHPA